MAVHRIRDKSVLSAGTSGFWCEGPAVTIQFNINVKSSAESGAPIGILVRLMGMEPVHG
jgi:hypothetical protein